MERWEFLQRVESAADYSGLFSFGKVVVSKAALKRLEELEVEPQALIALHHTGDWGDVDEDDRVLNEEGLQDRVSICH